MHLNKIIVNLSILLLFVIQITKAQETVTVQCNATIPAETQFMQGFLHGGPLYLDSTLTAKLRPSFWRVGAYWLAGSSYEDAEIFNPRFTVSINDIYMIANGITDQHFSQPWVDNWHSWDSITTVVVNEFKINSKPVEFWDIWNEPDNFWSGTYEDWIEMYRRTDSIIHSIDTDAKIVGPDFGFGACDFSVVPLLDLLDTLHNINSLIDAVSWHEFCTPEEVVEHVNELRDSLSVRPWASDLLINIPEYAGPANHIIPGWNVGWLYYLEQAQVNWVSHACWNESDGVSEWSDCQFGLNGLFMSDNKTPQPNYWVHRIYADLPVTRLTTTTDHPKTVALAGKNDVTNELKILVGRYDNPDLGLHNATADVVVKIEDYPYCSTCTTPLIIQRIPSNDVNYSIPLYAPVTTLNATINIVDGGALISISDFIDGDAYVVYVNPAEGSISSIPNNSFSELLKVVPNPVKYETKIVSSQYLSNANITIYNQFGKVVLYSTQIIGDEFLINTTQFVSGIYYVKIDDTNNQVAQTKFIVVN